jgi:peptidoglycan hydrolase-like protein with peptidoglycan-binding domain
MNFKLLVAALFFLAISSVARADQAIESAQQKLTEQGFYYGEINGKKDADTTAAIRRYQIRNGLPITGEIDAATQRSLGLTSKPASTPEPRSTSTPGPTPPDYRAESPVPRNPAARPASENDAEDEGIDGPGPRMIRPETSGVFRGTLFEAAPLDAQRRVVAGAQLLLMRQGFYNGGIDGLFGAGTEQAIRAYQMQIGLRPNGRLDTETLTSLGLLGGRRTPGFGPPRPRIYPPRTRIGPTGERIYLPN